MSGTYHPIYAVRQRGHSWTLLGGPRFYDLATKSTTSWCVLESLSLDDLRSYIVTLRSARYVRVFYWPLPW